MREPIDSTLKVRTDDFLCGNLHLLFVQHALT